MTALPPISPALIEALDVPGPRYTSYPTVPEWSDAFGAEAHAKALREASRTPDAPLGLYVHIPFCEERCAFCGCNVVVTRSSEKAERYLDYLEREMDLVCAELGERRSIRQLHWGGGTPTFLTVPQIERLMEMVRARFRFTEDAELALEVDPVVTTEAQIQRLAELGFNRISMGVQDFDPEVQEAIHRVQTVDATRTIVAHARNQGFGSVNFDLIYGLPRQTLDSWRRTIDQVIELSPDRLALYGFAFLPQLRPHQKRLPLADIPAGPVKHELYRSAYEQLLGAGYEPIGMDHFAKPTDELVRAKRERRLGRNFMGYTVRSASDTVAVGLTAISDVAGAFAQNVPQMKKYEAALDAGRLPVLRGLARSEQDERRGRIIQDLMCNAWVDLGPEAETEFRTELERLEGLERLGLCRRQGGQVELTALGGIFVRNVAMVFDAYLDQGTAQYSRTV